MNFSLGKPGWVFQRKVSCNQVTPLSLINPNASRGYLWLCYQYRNCTFPLQIWAPQCAELYVGSLFTNEQKRRRLAHDVIYPLLLCMSTLFIPQTQNARHETKMTMLTMVYRSAIMRSIFNNWVTEKLLWVYFFIPLLLTMKRAYGEHYFAPLLLIDVDIFCIPFAIFHTTNCRHIF